MWEVTSSQASLRNALVLFVTRNSVGDIFMSGDGAKSFDMLRLATHAALLCSWKEEFISDSGEILYDNALRVF